MIRAIKASTSSRIPYTLVSMAAILRDHIDPEYKNTEHEHLTDIADSLYNVGRSMVDEFKAEYKELYDKYGADYFDKVIEDMRALDDQLTSDAKVEELLADYEDRLKGVSASVKAATAVTASDYNPYLVRVSKATQKYILDELNRSSKVRDEFDNDSYKFEFMPTVSGTGVWASPEGLKILDEADIDYELINKATTASTRISASIELIDTIGYIKNGNGKFDVCVVETPYADMQLATYDPVEDEYDILETVKDLDDARKKATAQFKSQPEFVMASGNPFYDKLSDKDKKFVKSVEKQMAAETEEVTPANIYELAAKLLPPEDIDHHETDLYIRQTPESRKLIAKLQPKSLLSTFIDNIDHVTWYELPFCYDPEWERRLGNR